MRDKIEKVLDNNIDYYGTSKEDLLNELCILFGVSNTLEPKEVKSCMKADLKCGEVCKEHCGASWC